MMYPVRRSLSRFLLIIFSLILSKLMVHSLKMFLTIAIVFSWDVGNSIVPSLIALAIVTFGLHILINPESSLIKKADLPVLAYASCIIFPAYCLTTILLSFLTIFLSFFKVSNSLSVQQIVPFMTTWLSSIVLTFICIILANLIIRKTEMATQATHKFQLLGIMTGLAIAQIMHGLIYDMQNSFYYYKSDLFPGNAILPYVLGLLTYLGAVTIILAVVMRIYLTLSKNNFIDQTDKRKNSRGFMHITLCSFSASLTFWVFHMWSYSFTSFSYAISHIFLIDWLLLALGFVAIMVSILAIKGTNAESDGFHTPPEGGIKSTI